LSRQERGNQEKQRHKSGADQSRAVHVVVMCFFSEKGKPLIPKVARKYTKTSHNNIKKPTGFAALP
jgi:hypothetical protein